MDQEQLLGRIERTSVIAEVMKRIRSLIESGNLSPGSRLPSERELRESLGVGRSTVREALRALDALGLVEVRQGKGTYVRSAPANASDMLTMTEASHSDWEQLDRIVEARLPIETYAASLAAIRRTDEQLAQLAERLGDFERAIQTNDLSKLVLADIEFHNLIADVASPVLLSCLDSIGVLLINSRRMSLSRADRLPHVLDKHRLIYEAIAATDPGKASQAMSDHLLDFISELGFQVGTFPPDPSRTERDDTYFIVGRL